VGQGENKSEATEAAAPNKAKRSAKVAETQPAAKPPGTRRPARPPAGGQAEAKAGSATAPVKAQRPAGATRTPRSGRQVRADIAGKGAVKAESGGATTSPKSKQPARAVATEPSARALRTIRPAPTGASGSGKEGDEVSHPTSGLPPWRAPFRSAGTALIGLVGLVIVLIFIAALFLAILTRESPRGAPAALGQRAFIILSGSMTPTFDVGDLIVDRTISRRQAQHLHRGQIISFELTSHAGGAEVVITHRIYRVRREINAKTQHYTTLYETKGDDNPAPDDNRILPAQVIGTYEKRIPDAGYVLEALHQPVVFVLVISVPFAVLIILEARRRWKLV